MALQDYKDGVELFNFAVSEWNRASAELKRMRPDDQRSFGSSYRPKEAWEIELANQLRGQQSRLVEKTRGEALDMAEMTLRESSHLLPFLPHLDSYRDALGDLGWATRGTLLRRVMIDPDQLSPDGRSVLLYTKDFTGGSFGGPGFVEFAPPNQLSTALSFAENGSTLDTKKREDAVIIAVNHKCLIHQASPYKITIDSDKLRGQRIRIFRLFE